MQSCNKQINKKLLACVADRLNRRYRDFVTRPAATQARNYKRLCTYHWLSRGLTPGTPTGNPWEHAGNGTFLTIFWARGVGTLFGFGNERFRPQGCTPGTWSPLVSGTWFSKSRMNSLPPFVFHFLDLLHVCSSSCRCTKPGMFYEEKESLLLPTVSMNSL